MKKKIFAVLAVSILLLGLLCACGESNAITAEKAQKIAMEDAGLKQKDVSDVHAHAGGDQGYSDYLHAQGYAAV